MSDRRYETDNTRNCSNKEPHKPHFWTNVTWATYRCGGIRPLVATLNEDYTSIISSPDIEKWNLLDTTPTGAWVIYTLNQWSVLTICATEDVARAFAEHVYPNYGVVGFVFLPYGTDLRTVLEKERNV